jgi:hypothetical protein
MFVLVQVVENIFLECASLLLGTTNLILSNFYPSLAKTHVLNFRVYYDSFGPSFGLGTGAMSLDNRDDAGACTARRGGLFVDDCKLSLGPFPTSDR